MKIVYTALMVLIHIAASAQDFDKRLISKQISCSEVAESSSKLFIYYYEHNNLDSAHQLLQYWEQKCGLRETVFRAKLLLALKEGYYTDSTLGSSPLTEIFAYKNRVSMDKSSAGYNYDYNKNYYGYIPPKGEYDLFSMDAGKKLMTKYKPSQIEYLLSEFYATGGDSIFTKLQDQHYTNNTLSDQYFENVRSFTNKYETHIGGIVGVWIPSGKLNIMGVHPEIGVQLGVKRKKMNYDVTMAFRFLKSANNYYARREAGSIPELTDRFWSAYIGAECGRDIYARKRNELQVIAGGGIDAFEVLKEVKPAGLKSSSASSYNINLGLGYRYYWTAGIYTGLRIKYNIVDYTLNNRIDFAGHTISIQFTTGGLSNLYHYNLKALRYRLRE